MRTTALMLLLCLPLLGLAQTGTDAQGAPASQEPQRYESSIPLPPAPPKNVSASDIMYPGITPDMLKAPQTGQPLEARDLLILTGKDKPQGTYQSMYSWGLMGNYGGGYYGGGYYGGGYYGGGYYGGQGYPLSGSALSDTPGLDTFVRQRPFLFSSANGQFFVVDPRRLKQVSIFGPVVSPFLPVNPIFSGPGFSGMPQGGPGNSGIGSRPGTVRRP